MKPAQAQRYHSKSDGTPSREGCECILLLSMLGIITILLWLWLMFMAFVRRDYRLPFISKWARIFI